MQMLKNLLNLIQNTVGRKEQTEKRARGISRIPSFVGPQRMVSESNDDTILTKMSSMEISGDF